MTKKADILSLVPIVIGIILTILVLLIICYQFLTKAAGA